MDYTAVTNSPQISTVQNNKGLFLCWAIYTLQVIRWLCSHLILVLTLRCRPMDQPLFEQLLSHRSEADSECFLLRNKCSSLDMTGISSMHTPWPEIIRPNLTIRAPGSAILPLSRVGGWGYLENAQNPTMSN